MSYIDKTVVALTDSWTFSIDENGQRGTKKFIYADAFSGRGFPQQQLPSILDSWSATYDKCYLKVINISYLNNDGNCYQVYECIYDSQVPDTAQADTNNSGVIVNYDETQLPFSISTGGEIVTWEPPVGSETHHWANDGATVAQPIFRIVNNATIMSKRFVYSGISDVLNKSFELQGKLNNAIFFGKPVGTILYNGCTVLPYIGKNIGNSTTYYSVEFNFSYRTVPDAPRSALSTGESDGWNFQLREDTGTFEGVYEVGATTGLYKLGNLKELYTTSPASIVIPILGNVT